MATSASESPRDLLATCREPVEAVGPMAVGSLTTVLVARNLGHVGHTLRAVEHALLVYFLVDLGLALAVEGTAVGPLRWVETAVLVPYAALVALSALSVAACGGGPLAGLRGLLVDVHGGLALCRELVALDALAGAGAVAVLADRGSSDSSADDS